LADIPPATAHCNHNSERWHWNELILSQYWSPNGGVDSSLFGNGNGNGNNLESQPHHLTYGEVTPLGVRQLAYEMDIANCDDGDDQRRTSFDNENNNNDDDDDEIVFYDLGSGVGRLVTQMYIDQPDRVTKAIGIELAEYRHEIGARALEGIMEKYNGEGQFYPSDYGDNNVFTSMITTMPFSIQLIHGDAVEVDFDSTTTHVFVSSLCFPENVLLAIQEKLLRLPNIRVVAALNRLDLIHQRGREEWKERDVPIQMSWGASSAKIYHKVV